MPRFFVRDIDDVEVYIDDDKMVKMVAANYRPDEVFGQHELEEWARDNGFVEKERCGEE